MNFLIKEEPSMVVIITITSATVNIYFLSLESICKHKANAITPRIIPLNQHTFNYFDDKGNGLFTIL